MRRIINQFVWDDEVHYSVNNERFEAMHWSLDVAANEAALRFPNSSQYEKMVWTYLYAKAWRGGIKNSVDARVSAFARPPGSRVLCSGEWGERVVIYDFIILHIADVENLFGDGRTIPIYKIETSRSDGMDGLYFAMENDDEKFRITPILGYWPASHGYWVGEPVIGDHTADDLPEFVVMPRGHSGSICYSTYMSGNGKGKNL